MNKNVIGTAYKMVLIISVFSIFSSFVNAQNKLGIYGYFSTRLEKQFETKSSSTTIADATPFEWSYPYFNIMMQDKLTDDFKVYVNLNGSDASKIDLRNFWGEYTFNNYLTIRLGKIYRKFGLYNEILDAVPTYYGIEPPELFDADHLMISRTTTVMAYGRIDLNAGDFNYSFSSDNGEGGAVKNSLPLGMDLNYKSANGDYKIGTSAYTSGGTAVPDVSLGSGSPKSGVLPWMTADHFDVFGGYLELNHSNILVQAAYWQADHHAERDPASVITVVQNAGISNSQIGRFLINPTKDVSTLTSADVIRFVNFKVQTWYVRTGYSFDTKIGEIAPYLQWDWYSNPETIENKKYGGDAEAGAAGNGVFNKSTVGIVYRPTIEVAIKLDQSFHFYKGSNNYSNKNVYYPEIRFDVSFFFGN